MKCSNCGKDIKLWAWLISSFSPICVECKKIKMGKINQYLDKISEYGADNYLDKQEEKELDDLRAKLELNYDDITEANRRIRNLKMESPDFLLAKSIFQ